MHLQRADDSYLARLTKVYDPAEHPATAGFWTLHATGIMPPGPDTPTRLDVKAEGFVVRAAWRVQCPFCAGCQFGHPELQDRFMCVACANRQDGWVRVAWPADLDEIETALLARRDPTHMHWYPHEAPEHLHAENIIHHIYDLTAVPKHRQRLVRFLVDGHYDADKAHVIAPGVIVHPDSEWYPKMHADIVKTLGKSVSESNIRRALMIYAKG